jgi:YVTN family beta-propeller protein
MKGLRFFIGSLLTISILVFVACTKDSASPLYNDYPTEVGKIMVNKCATSGCHNDASYQAAASLNLSSYASLFNGSVNGSPVIPYRSDFSSLCYFINTYEDLGPINIPTMPLNGTKLSKEEVNIIKNWIDKGAPDINGNVMWSNMNGKKRYYVLNQGCDVVTVFDGTTKLPIRYITVGNNPNVSESPHMIKVSPDGKYWYVIFLNNSIFQKYSTSNNQLIAEVNLGGIMDWNTMRISEDGKRAYLVSWQTNSRLAIINTENMSLLKNIGGIANAHGCALNKTNDTIYITAQSGNYIYKIDTGATSLNTIIIDNSGVINSTPGSIDPHGIIFSPDGSKYFITCQSSNEVRVLRTSDNALLATIPTGRYPQEIAMSIKKNSIYISCQNDPNPNPRILGSVTEINMDTYQYSNYKLGYQLHGIEVDDELDLVIVASRNISSSGPLPHHTGECGRNGFINYFQLSTMTLLTKKTEVASDPYSIAVTP